MKILFSLLAFLFIYSLTVAQTTRHQLGTNDMFSNNSGSATVNIIGDAKIMEVINLKKNLNEDIKGMSGYRVQVFFASGAPAKQKAQQVKESLQRQFPDIEFYIGYQAPYFTVKAGDFRSRLEALVFKSKLTDESQALWIMKETIKFPKL